MPGANILAYTKKKYVCASDTETERGKGIELSASKSVNQMCVKWCHLSGHALCKLQSTDYLLLLNVLYY